MVERAQLSPLAHVGVERGVVRAQQLFQSLGNGKQFGCLDLAEGFDLLIGIKRSQRTAGLTEQESEAGESRLAIGGIA